jgi:hypothetical protein
MVGRLEFQNSRIAQGRRAGIPEARKTGQFEGQSDGATDGEGIVGYASGARLPRASEFRGAASEFTGSSPLTDSGFPSNG